MKTRKNKNLNFYTLKNYLTKIRDLQANLKGNDKYNKKWTVISNIRNYKKLIKTKSSEKVLQLIKILVHFIYLFI